MEFSGLQPGFEGDWGIFGSCSYQKSFDFGSKTGVGFNAQNG
jgi:hypothetical protein